MKVLLDLNVLLDVIQEREPHYAASAAVLSRIASGEIEGAVELDSNEEVELLADVRGFLAARPRGPGRCPA